MKTKQYNVTLTKMTPQTTFKGKVKRDAHGKPLQSVRIKQNHKQKISMLREMFPLSELYDTAPQLFPTGNYQVGNDPKEYTIKQMMGDFYKRLDVWTKDTGADLYKSFIDRHNFILDIIDYGAHIKQIELVDTITPSQPKSKLTGLLDDSDLFY